LPLREGTSAAGSGIVGSRELAEPAQSRAVTEAARTATATRGERVPDSSETGVASRSVEPDVAISGDEDLGEPTGTGLASTVEGAPTQIQFDAEGNALFSPVDAFLRRPVVNADEPAPIRYSRSVITFRGHQKHLPLEAEGLRGIQLSCAEERREDNARMLKDRVERGMETMLAKQERGSGPPRPRRPTGPTKTVNRWLEQDQHAYERGLVENHGVGVDH
jgi:hypothetical protein